MLNESYAKKHIASAADGRLTVQDFSDSFGVSCEELPKTCLELIENIDFSYRLLDQEEIYEFILCFIKKSDNSFIVGTPQRKKVWYDGWQENLELFRREKNTDMLIPKYYAHNFLPARLGQNIAMPSSDSFHYDLFRVFRSWLLHTYGGEYNTVCEFGCGPSHNLVWQAKNFPGRKIYGLDFVLSSMHIIDELNKAYGYNISGHLFDAVNPSASGFTVPHGSLVYTVGMIEQLAEKYKSFIDYLIDQQPGLCLFFEPVCEVYDENNLFDYLADRFHRARHYPVGLLPYLQELEAQGKVEILKVKTMSYGNSNMERNTLIVWRPVNKN